jgi:hypothetical protein
MSHEPRPRDEAARRMTLGGPEVADWANSAWSWALLVWQHDNPT